MTSVPGRRLLIDADDTLWENHGYFLDALASFGDLVEEQGSTREAAFACLDAIERERTRRFGYGSRFFVKSLLAAAERLLGPQPTSIVARLEAFGERIYSHPIVPFPGVKETLAALADRRYVLHLVTKGQPDEQVAKLERSGLAGFFHAVDVLSEKDVASYVELTKRHALDSSETWMIGNAPKSDILAARGAGLRTVHIPHRTTWFLEDVPLDPPPDLTLERFRQLTDHF